MDTEKYTSLVLGENVSRTHKSAKKWKLFLEKNISDPIRVTGIEDFPWEEPYIFGDWCEEEYEELKETNPSYTDEYDLHKLILDKRSDTIEALVCRISDKKEFTIPLDWLEGMSDLEKENQILDAYAVWHVNH